jgi:hypothetical protein
MDEYAVDVLPDEVLQWARADERREPQQLWVRASKEYRVDQTAVDEEAIAARTGEDDLGLVAVEGVLELSPQYGPRDWILRVRAETTIEQRQAGDDETESNETNALTLDAFESEFVRPDPDNIEVTVLAENRAAWERFQDWLAIQRQANRG